MSWLKDKIEKFRKDPEYIREYESLRKEERLYNKNSEMDFYWEELYNFLWEWKIRKDREENK